MPLRLVLPSDLSKAKEKFLIPLCLILGLIVWVPILEMFVVLSIFIDIFLSVIFISMVYTISQKKSHLLIGTLLSLVMLASMWSQYFYQNPHVFAVGKLFGVLFIVMVIGNILAFIFKSEEVTKEVIFAAMLVYLLAALLWSFAYGFLEIVDPASFNVALGQDYRYQMKYIYFSFVTITTLGYGDITPATDLAKSFTILEAVVGQLYLVVVVAWLVGMHVSRKSN